MLQERLIETAIYQFGQHGFDGASTRAIAQASGTAMSSITYHFGGKEGLYLACADYIAAQIRLLHINALELVRDVSAFSHDVAIQHCLTIIDNFAAMMIDPQSAHWARFIMREQHSPTEAFERLYQGAMKDMIEGFGNLLGRARPDLEPLELRATIMLIFGQALVLRAGRASVCKALGTDNLGEDESRLLRARIRANSLAILTGGNA